MTRILTAVAFSAALALAGTTAPSSAQTQPAPALGPFAFAVDLQFSPAAARLLADRKEQVGIAASFFAEPNKAGKRYADANTGMIEVGSEEIRVAPTSPRAVITGRKITPETLARILDRKTLQVNVNAYSARLSSPDNLLHCEMIEAAVAVLREKGATIRCKLLIE